MKVLIVCSYRSYLDNGIAPFIQEQTDAIQLKGTEIEYFLIKKKGIWGYLQEFPRFKRAIRSYKPDIIHAHYGLCGVFANLQRKLPVVTTYHGSDINEKRNLFFSKISMYLSTWNIFVSQKQVHLSGMKKKYSVIPCGVNKTLFYPMDKMKCKEKLKLALNKNYILFSKDFSLKVKNSPLAIAAVEKIPNTELLELKGYSRQEVCYLLNACDLGLMTSFTEGSPQFIKEALACATPVVSTDVGDVKEIIEDVNACYICTYEVEDVVEKVKQSMKDIVNNKFELPVLKNEYNNEYVAQKIINLYINILKQRF